jgi:sec-independent protein translocase protein TatB
MFNVGGGELMIILLVALLVLGPQKLPSAAKQFGKVMSDFRKMSSGFQREMREAMNDPVEAATRDRSNPADSADDGSGTGSAEVSTAEEAGMYEAETPPPSDQPDNEDES